jgi:hypothetical protein
MIARLEMTQIGHFNDPINVFVEKIDNGKLRLHDGAQTFDGFLDMGWDRVNLKVIFEKKVKQIGCGVKFEFDQIQLECEQENRQKAISLLCDACASLISIVCKNSKNKA